VPQWPASLPAHKEIASWQIRIQSGTSTLELVLAWGFVGIPLAWGVAQTIANAMKLFQ
jgi:hypothetical protein